MYCKTEYTLTFYMYGFYMYGLQFFDLSPKHLFLVKTESSGTMLGLSSQYLRCTTACAMLPPPPPPNYSTLNVFTTQDSSDGEEVDSAADDASLVEDRHDDDILDLPTHRAPSHSHWALPLSHSHMSSSRLSKASLHR